MHRQLRNPNFYLMLSLDVMVFASSLLGAHLLWFDFLLSDYIWDQISWLLPGMILVKIVVFALMGMYTGMWRYTGVPDMLRLAAAVALCTIIIIFGVYLLTRCEGMCFSIFIIDAGLTFLLAGAGRIAIRIIMFRRSYLDIMPFLSNNKPQKTAHRIIIVGAGDAGEKALRELRENLELSHRVIGFVDDNPAKVGKTIHGVPVLGKVEDLPRLSRDLDIHELFIAIPSVTGQQLRTILNHINDTHVPYKILPGLGELIDGKVSIKALRDVRYEDLLGRPVVELDMGSIASYLMNRVVMVTGAGGSIGRELCRQILRFDPSMLLLFDASEPGLYSIQMELKHKKGYLKYRTVLGTACDRSLLQGVFEVHRPSVVFHAAAYKHVPMLERNPWQAVKNNVKATYALMDAAEQYGCETFVMISTDKAVKPTNVMGASKRVCERLMYAYTGGKTRFMAVRFGNVVGSAGSVVPLFREQIERGGPVTVTHPEVTRYFMTIPEACRLVLQAGALGKGGELFVLKMGTPVKIADMARDLIRLSGKEPDEDIEVVYTGLRPGEKLYEELITQGENILRTEHDKIMVIGENGHYARYGGQQGYRQWILKEIEELEQRAATYDANIIKGGFKMIVPEYEVQNDECVF